MEVHFKGFQKACLFTSHWESISGRPKLSCCLSPSSPLSSAAQGQIVLTKHSDLYSDWSQKVSYSQSGALNTIIRFSLLFKNNLHKGYYLLWYVFKLTNMQQLFVTDWECLMSNHQSIRSNWDNHMKVQYAVARTRSQSALC